MLGATVQISTGGALGTGTVSLLGRQSTAAALKLVDMTTVGNALVTQGKSVVDVASGTTATISGAISGGGDLPRTPIRR